MSFLNTFSADETLRLRAQRHEHRQQRRQARYDFLSSFCRNERGFTVFFVVVLALCLAAGMVFWFTAPGPHPDYCGPGTYEERIPPRPEQSYGYNPNITHCVPTPVAR